MPGARAGPRDRLARAGGGHEHPARLDGARHALGPRRQGRDAGGRAADRRAARMNLETTLRAQRDAGKKLLVPYVTGGLGAAWLDVVRAVAAAGADAIEIGIPFSDPVMDGRTIQEASQRALDLGATPADIVGRPGRARRRRPARRDDLLQPGAAHGPRAVRRRARRGGRRRRDRARPPARRARTAGATRPTRPASRPCCSPAPTTPDERLRADLRADPRLRLRRRAAGRHRRARPPARPGQGDGASGARPSPTSRCSSGSASPTRSRRPRPRTRPTA